MRTWSCRIGEVEADQLPDEADAVMRAAVIVAYENLTGRETAFIFSGWGYQLPEWERAVVENRLPDPEVIYLQRREEILPVERQLAIEDSPLAIPHRVAETRRHFRDTPDGLPRHWRPEQWIAAVNVQLGQAAEVLHQALHGGPPTGVERAKGMSHLLAVAALAMDAVEALEGARGFRVPHRVGVTNDE